MPTITHDISPPSGNGVQPPTPRWTRGRVAAVTFIVLIAGFWFWALLLAPRGSPDIIDNDEFAAAAEARCKIAQDAVDGLPNARAASTPVERAAVLDQANNVVRSLVDDLRVLAADPQTAHDRKLFDLWLADYAQYATDREDYSRQLRSNANIAFGVTARKGQQITKAIDAFAGRNRMKSCQVPDDL